MLVRLLPKQITDSWNVIKYALKNSMPPQAEFSDEAANNILKALISGDMQCWTIASDNEVLGITITTITDDRCSGERNLLIYSVFGFKKIPDRVWRDGLDSLKKYAAGMKAKYIVALTVVDRVKEIVRNLGGNADWTFLKLEV